MNTDRVTDADFREAIADWFQPHKVRDWAWLIVEGSLETLLYTNPTATPEPVFKQRLSYAIEKLRETTWDMKKVDDYLTTLIGQGRW